MEQEILEEEEEVQNALNSSEPVGPLELAKKELENIIEHEDDEEDQRPTQDSLEVDDDEFEEAEDQNLTSKLVQSGVDQVELDKTKTQGKLQRGNEVEADTEFPSSDNPSSSHSRSVSPSLAFVDVKEDVNQASPNSVANTKSKKPTYHPETTLSHAPEEQTKKQLGSSRVTLRRSENTREGNSTRSGQALFFGSDDEAELPIKQVGTIAQAKKRQTMTRPHLSSGKVASTAASKDFSSAALAKSKISTQRTGSASVGPSKQQVTIRKERNRETVDSGNKSGVEARKKRKRKAEKEERQKRRREHKRDSDDDLVQNLNVDAFTRSTSNKEIGKRRVKSLAQLKRKKLHDERKRKGLVSSSESSSSSSSSSESSSDMDEDSANTNFIVEDDGPAPTRGVIHRSTGAVSKARLSLSPPSIVSKDYLSDIRSVPRREKLQEYIRWVVVEFVELTVGADRKAQLKAVRTHLQEKFKSEFNSLTSQSNRRQFTWYLKHYPKFERRLMTSAEKREHVGCSACHRTTQKCEYAFSCWGFFYNRETLYQNSDYSSSEMSTEAEDLKHGGKNNNGEKVFTFYLGESCAKYAGIKHKLHHWERRVLNEIVKLPTFKALKKKSKRETIETEDIEAVVTAYYPKLSARYAKLEQDAAHLRTNSERLNKLKESWDDDP